MILAMVIGKKGLLGKGSLVLDLGYHCRPRYFRSVARNLEFIFLRGYWYF